MREDLDVDEHNNAAAATARAAKKKKHERKRKMLPLVEKRALSRFGCLGMMPCCHVRMTPLRFTAKVQPPQHTHSSSLADGAADGAAAGSGGKPLPAKK